MTGLRLYRRKATSSSPLLQEQCVATIGNFDGMHGGHRQVIRKASEEASARSLPMVVVLFEPQPLEFLRPDVAPGRLMRMSEKLACLADWGVEHVLCLRFDDDLAAMSADDFISKILVQTLRARMLIVGDDFRFGQNRQGDFNSLTVAGERFGFTVQRQASVLLNDARLSSTRVRDALVANDLSLARRLLGRPFSKGGCVIPGAKRGRRLGFPTVNIVWRGEALLAGIYTSRLHCDGQTWNGVSYVGRRPFYGDIERVLMETHLLDYQGDLYGRWVWLDFLNYLRGEQHFANTDELVAQIGKDIERARHDHKHPAKDGAEQGA